MSAPDHVSAEGLSTGRWEGREAFADHVRQSILQAAREGWQQIVLSDSDFADWPLNERAVVEALNHWAHSGRQLRVLARDFNILRTRAPRWVQWRITWDHLVQARACVGAAAADLPSAVWTPTWILERLDSVHSIGVATKDPRRRTELRERLNTYWQRGCPALPSSTLGL